LHLGHWHGGCIKGLGGDSQSLSRAVHSISSTKTNSTVPKQGALFSLVVGVSLSPPEKLFFG
jgi:hypothetical protein